MKVGRQSFNIKALVDYKKADFVKLVDVRACKKSVDEVWKMFVIERKKYK